MDEILTFIRPETVKETLSSIEKLDEQVEELIDKNNKNAGLFFSLMTFYYPDNLEMMEKIYYYLLANKLAKFRHCKILLNYYLNKSEKDAIEFYYHSVKPFIPVDYHLINFLIEKKSFLEFQKILLDFIGKRIIIPDIFENKTKLKYETIKFPLTSLLKRIEEHIATQVSPDKLYQFKFIVNRDISYCKKQVCVIDGNNFLLTQKGEITLKTIFQLKNLMDFVSKTFDIIVFVHQRHQKTINKLVSFLNSKIIYTPASFNDDWFSLYFAIKNNCYLLSNDRFIDHIFLFDTLHESDDLKNFLEIKQIKFQQKLIMPLNYSKIIQGDNTKILIPGITGFYCHFF
jgi:hypothetical protein